MTKSEPKRKKCKICGRFYLPYQVGEHYKKDTEVHKRYFRLKGMSTLEMMRAINRGEI